MSASNLSIKHYSYGPYVDSRFPGVYYFGNPNEVNVSLGETFRNSNDNPNWKEQVARGIDASTPYSVLKREVESLARAGAVVKVDRRATYGYTIDGYCNIRSLPEGPAVYHDPITRDIALKKLKNKLSGDLKQFKALIPLVELREMRRLLNQSTRLVKDTVLYLLQPGRSKDPRAWLRFAQEKWLMMNFGVMPILSDATNLAQAINEKLTSRGHKVLYRGSHTSDYAFCQDDSSESGSIAGTHSVNYRQKIETRHRVSYRFTAGVDTSVICGNNYDVEDHFGLTFRDLPSALWELTAYSWIVDYGSTVGEYLEDVFSSPGVATTYVVENHRCVSDQVYTLEPKKSNENDVKMSSSYSTPGSQKMFYQSRTPLASIPRRILRFKTADEVGKHAVTKLLNLASLLKNDMTLERVHRRGPR